MKTKQSNKTPFFKLIVVILAVSFVACQENEPSAADTRKNGYTPELKNKKDSLYQEVMDGHDVGMARMGKIIGYQKSVKASIDSLQKLRNPDKNKLALFQSIADDLNQAEYSMSRWMTEFKIDSAENDEEARIAYLESEKIKVNAMRDRVLRAVERSDSLYGK